MAKDRIGFNGIGFQGRNNLCGSQNAFLAEKGDMIRKVRCSAYGASVRNSDVSRTIYG